MNPALVAFRRPVRLASAAVAAAVLVGAAPGSVDQSVSLDRATGSPGDQVDVSLAGWAPGPVQVDLCGNSASRGTADCDPLASVATAVGDDGSAQLAFTVSVPPVPCPCVFRVAQPTSGASATVPFEVTGAAIRPAPPTVATAARRSIEVVSAVLEPDEGAPAQFGFDARRRATVVLRNSGTVELIGVSLSATIAGRGADSTPVGTLPAFDLAPLQERTVQLDIGLPAPAFGEYRVVVRIDGGDEPVTFSVGTSHLPLGLVNAAVLAVLVFAQRSRRA